MTGALSSVLYLTEDNLILADRLLAEFLYAIGYSVAISFKNILCRHPIIVLALELKETGSCKEVESACRNIIADLIVVSSLYAGRTT